MVVSRTAKSTTRATGVRVTIILWCWQVKQVALSCPGNSSCGPRAFVFVEVLW